MQVRRNTTAVPGVADGVDSFSQRESKKPLSSGALLLAILGSARVYMQSCRLNIVQFDLAKS